MKDQETQLRFIFMRSQGATFFPFVTFCIQNYGLRLRVVNNFWRVSPHNCPTPSCNFDCMKPTNRQFRKGRAAVPQSEFRNQYALACFAPFAPVARNPLTGMDPIN